MQFLNSQTKKNNFFQLLLLLISLSFIGSAIAVEKIKTAKLKINFPGLKSVHTEIKISDGIKNSASGKSIKKSNWKNNSTTVIIPRGRYDIVVKKGSGTLIIDNVNCLSSSCTVNKVTAKMTVLFPKLSSVHTSVFVSDNIKNSTSSEKVTYLNWKKNKAVLTVLRQKYDVRITKGTDSIIVDNVNCLKSTCVVKKITAKMVVKFPGLNAVHTSIYKADGIANMVSGAKSFYQDWKNNQAVLTVFKKQYDVSIRRKNALPLIRDNVDCRSGHCKVDKLVATLSVKFPGMSSIHTSVHQPDNQAGSAEGKEFAHKNWQKNKASITVLRQLYDLRIKGNSTKPMIIDNVDCTSGSCAIDKVTATLTVKFPKMSSVHTTVFIPDGKKGVAEGTKVFNKRWQKNQVVLTVFKQKYDVSIKTNTSAPIIKDNVDCTSGSCSIEKITATLTVKFPKMSGVHTSALVPDGKTGIAKGTKAFALNWQKDQAIINVFKQKYDVTVKNNHSDPIIKDNVDCTSGSCRVDQITAILTVKFPKMSGVHTSVHISDNETGVVNGPIAFKLNWQKNEAIIPVFKQFYDISVRNNRSTPMVIDAIDCTSGNCVVNDLTATLKVDFPKLSNVHTSVRIPDNKKGSAGGSQVTYKNWQKDKAIITVFKQKYDVQVKKGPISKIIDNVDCTSGNCSIKELISTLTIDFPGLGSVHSSAHVPDSIKNQAKGVLASKSNWKTHQTTIALLRETYDVKVHHGTNSIFDNVDCNSANCKVLVKGNVQAILINGDLNKPIADKYLTAYEKLSNGSLKKVMKGKTTAQGQVNFTLNGLSSGKVYVLKVYSPFGNGKNYYSAFITNEGQYKFIVTVDGENSLDLTPPVVSISSPQNGGNVTDQGFVVTGSATDNRKIDKVELTVTDPVKGSKTILGSYDEKSQLWTANVPGTIISLNENIVLTATAFDLAQSQNTATVIVSVVEDTDGPVTTISSHIDNDQVPATGFLLSGTVTDLTGVASLQATLVDSTLGTQFTAQNVNFSINNGAWTLVIDNGLMTEGGSVDITFNAADTVGNTSSTSIHLLVVAVNFSNAHMINRITFGTTPTLIQEVASSGAQAFLEQQLDPASIDDNEFTSIMGDLPSDKKELQAWTLRHMAFSKRQLLEVMTWFWDNHFNTNINTKRKNAQNKELAITVQYELAENQAFRNNALGNFRDLLEISAKSPAMLIYLDSISNVAGGSNENYAREVDELHTLGVNGGYTSQDIENGAEIFTGWHVKNGTFFFDNNRHTVGSYTMFQGTPQQLDIPVGGVTQGEQLLDALSIHPSTATFICTKLVTLFVDDTPPTSLIARCSNEFLSFSTANNQIERVVRLILQSAEFNDSAHYRSKIKTPIEFVIGAIRNLEATSDASDLITPIREMGIALYENPLPTGWSEIGADWINTDLLIERMKWVNSFSRNSTSNKSISDPIQFYPNKGFATADGIVGYLLQLTVNDDFTPLARTNALNILDINFDLSNQDAEIKLRQLNGSVMSYPQYQFQ